MKKIKKRDSRLVEYDESKIASAIFKAAHSVGGQDKKLADELAGKVTDIINNSFRDSTPSVEDVQDAVEKVLIEGKHVKTAKAYILYRQRRKDIREAKSLLGVEDDIKITYNALKVLEGRYMLKDKEGRVIESTGELFKRVAHNIAEADARFGDDIHKSEEEFYNMMTSLEFMPNSPTLMNAGTSIQQLSACFVLPIEDTMEGIFDSLKNAALIHKTGGGTGFSFSRLRPKGDSVGSTSGVASGPVSFMKIFDAATEVIKQGGKRRGANMGILSVDHPDILEFITCKERNDVVTNFNISVAITEKFMDAVEKNEEYELINPNTKKPVSRLNAKSVFNLMCTMAWKNGDPGVVFIDRMNNPRSNPTPKLGRVEATNPCGEQPLLPYEACNLGSINLARHVKDGEVDWEKLRSTVRNGVHFLDNVIEMNKFPIKEIDDMVRGNRRIGLGIMGWADMLIKLGIPYNTKEALDLADKIMCFVNNEAKMMSVELAGKRGVFPNFKGSTYDTGKEEDKARNSTRTTIAPTGTISIISNCSSGVEPLFAISFLRKTPQFELLEVNPLFEEIARERGFYTDSLMKKIAMRGSIQGIDEIPEDVRRIFVTAMDLNPEDHVKMQAAFQKHVDNAVSKTVNFPYTATVEDVEKVYLLSYKLGCKGVTIYRDGSRDVQVLNIQRRPLEEKSEATEKEKMIEADATYAGGCKSCSVE